MPPPKEPQQTAPLVDAIKLLIDCTLGTLLMHLALDIEHFLKLTRDVLAYLSPANFREHALMSATARVPN